MSDPRTPGLLSLLPEGTEAGVIRRAQVWDSVGRSVPAPELVAAAARAVGAGKPASAGAVAYLLVLLIEQAKRCEALEAGLRSLLDEEPTCKQGPSRKSLRVACGWCGNAVAHGRPVSLIQHADDCPLPAARSLLESPEPR